MLTKKLPKLVNLAFKAGNGQACLREPSCSAHRKRIAERSSAHVYVTLRCPRRSPDKLFKSALQNDGIDSGSMTCLSQLSPTSNSWSIHIRSSPKALMHASPRVSALQLACSRCSVLFQLNTSSSPSALPQPVSLDDRRSTVTTRSRAMSSE
jgi:hypothetical protein